MANLRSWSPGEGEAESQGGRIPSDGNTDRNQLCVLEGGNLHVKGGDSRTPELTSHWVGAARVTEHTELSQSSLPSLHCFLAKLFPILELNA